ncbi:aminopeptidase [Anaerosalibacter massiliensis]|uniref:M18 family aminopeptidase n=1 Tax=Anaerosalibacter massiliensis TaxID=1347392 RepID=A0A9X2MG85_9FIRM|nr:aminopeptidase [Anaerosalibacter massiliensis]MCR2043069.1 aminopeptidase [Anaerosalibacter massiliensis]
MNGKELKEKLTFKFKNVWQNVNEEEKEELFNLNEDYKRFLDTSKTEREATKEIIKRVKNNGFKSINSIIKSGEKLKPGMKIYANNKDKAVALFVIGEESIEKGMNIIGSHIDSPRLDIKSYPLYEDAQLALLKTHYYGGIKKYQWVSQPLSLHGVIIKNNGEKVNIVIGEEDDDPVFFISDLLPHLSKEQEKKTLEEGIEGEGLNITIGSIPYNEKDLDEKIKINILKILNEKYGITEEDFTTAEISAVPAGKARDLGIDRSLILSYGHDDRVCAYTSLSSILEVEHPKRTSVALFVDKEEIGSVGNTGMHSKFFENTVAELVLLEGSDIISTRRALANSKVLSADVAAAFDPNYPEVFDKLNTAYLGKGIALIKYTGSGGKGGSSDANSEYINYIRRIFNENNIIWQTGELGKVDQGGGGTIAYILANYGMEVVDCGIPVLSMHAPYEAVSKADVYMTYKGYKAFYLA